MSTVVVDAHVPTALWYNSTLFEIDDDECHRVL